jgi:multiple sugar transport system permease protein/sn-glycerol 3-phosphate transport system permease protein
MAQQAARVDRTASRTSTDMLLPTFKRLQRLGLHLIAILMGIMLMLPFYWALSSSLKQVQEVRRIPPTWLPATPQWQNYADVWNVRMFAGWIGSSIFLVALAMTLSVILAACIGYAFARHGHAVAGIVASIAMVLCLGVVVVLYPSALEQTTLVGNSQMVIGLTPIAVIGAAVAGWVFARSESLSRGIRFLIWMALALLPGILLLVVNSGIFSMYGWISNSVFLTIVATTGTVISSSLGGYAFARFRFPGKVLLFSITMATLMLPGYVLLIPNFMLFWAIGWLNTYLPLTVPFWFGSAFFIFLFRQFFMTIPLDLDEAARIDGASYPRIFWSIILPLSGPVYATAFIIEGITQWNSFLRPFIVLNQPEYYPLSVGLRYFQVSPDALPKDHLLMAAAVIMALPVLIIFFVGQRYFVRGVAMTGIKG